MKPTLLLPHYFKIIGFISATTGIILGALFEFDDRYLPFLDYNGGHRSDPMIGLGDDNFTDEAATTLAILGLMLIGFSKFKLENQQTAKLRLKALYWAVLVNTGLMSVLMTDWRLSRTVNFAINNNFLLLLIIFIGCLYYLPFIKKDQAKLYYLPHRPFSLAGKISSIVLITGGLVISIYSFQLGDWTEFLPCLILPCILLWIWSKEKTEDEGTEGVRLQAMQLSVLINCGAFIALTWAIYGFNYLAVQFAALISIQLLFVILFYILKFMDAKSRDKDALASAPVIS